MSVLLNRRKNLDSLFYSQLKQASEKRKGSRTVQLQRFGDTGEKMQAIFLVEEHDKINFVYKQEAVNHYLKDFLPIKIYSKKDIVEDTKPFLEVKYIFSTWSMSVFSEEEVRKFFPALEAVFYAAGTVKYFAEPFLKNNIKVYAAAKANGIPVAEYTVAQIILANKGYYQTLRAYRKPIFWRSLKNAQGYANTRPGNYDAAVGLIGAGAIGMKVMELLRPYRLKIFVHDPYTSEEKLREMGAEKIDLPNMFKTCDVISNHLPNIKATKGILNESLFSLMKPSVTFINTGRGAQVVEKDLVKTMKKNPNACALLDVSVYEPLAPWSPLKNTKNIFPTPHIAGSLSQEVWRMSEFMYQAYQSHIDGEKSDYEVTLKMLPNMA